MWLVTCFLIVHASNYEWRASAPGPHFTDGRISSSLFMSLITGLPTRAWCPATRLQGCTARSACSYVTAPGCTSTHRSLSFKNVVTSLKKRDNFDSSGARHFQTHSSSDFMVGRLQQCRIRCKKFVLSGFLGLFQPSRPYRAEGYLYLW